MIGSIQGQSTMSADMMAQMRERMFAKMDPDGDGQIDLSQIQAEAKEVDSVDSHLARMLEDLQAADTDGDGMVSKEEFEAMKPPDGPPPGGPVGEMPDFMSALKAAEESDNSSLAQMLYSSAGESAESTNYVGSMFDLLG